MTLITNDINRIVNEFGQLVSEFEAIERRGNNLAAGNSTFAICGVSYSADSFVVTESSVFRINNCGKKHAHRKSANRQAVKN